MTTFSFTPLVAGAPELVGDVNTPLTAIQAILNGGIDSSNVTDGTLTPSDLTTALQDYLGVTGNVVRRGKAISVPSSDSRTNTAYGLLANPDRVQNVVMPTDGLISVWYQATWQESVLGAARAAIFIGANQYKMASAQAGPAPVQLAAKLNGSSVSEDHPLSTAGELGLFSPYGNNAYSGDATTGQGVGTWGGTGTAGEIELNGVAQQVTPTTSSGYLSHGGPCYIFAAAGTYDISVMFKASSGNVVAKNRRLWVESRAF
jgi:hypothetical protein